ncbi:hypothetical protein [Paenibacillus sp. MBLB4367]|uniref:hypothetical protein n=1 Tax=Paenibacillus sp. MBLB4367 TaxID=3384767 RepID=UPI0039083DBD
MVKRLIVGITMLCMLLMVISPAMANTSALDSDESWSRGALTEQVGQLNALIPATSRSQLKQFLESVRDNANTVLGSSEISDGDGKKTNKALRYALKLAADVNKEGNAALWTNTPFIVYDTPALSPDKRLPDTLPSDGTVSDKLSIISAQNEYEAASFVLAPLSDVNAVTFTPNALTGEGGTIPASAVDLRVVKTWYQGGTAWQSYFADPTKSVLVPELLLHDENLVQVDHTRKGNSVRVDYPAGSQYVDISNIPATKFDRWTQPVEDSSTLLPIALKQGESKQMWLTLKVPSGMAAGFYTGTIDIAANGAPAGQLTLTVRVLPFELPQPKTNYDLNKDFYVMIMHHARYKESLAESKGNTALVETSLLNQFRNLAEHNAVNIPPNFPYTTKDQAIFLRQLQLMQQAGLDLNPLFGVGQAFAPYQHFNDYNNYVKAKATYEANPTEANRLTMEKHYTNWRKGIDTHKQYVADAFNTVSNAVGHTNLFFDGWDEAGWSLLQYQQEMWKYIKEVVGGKVFATGNASHMNLETPEDFLDWAGEMTREKADQWHALGADKMITSYAYPHTGPENPDLMRQRHGMWLYKANYDATYNYVWYENPDNLWNDNYNATFPYRAFNLVYPTRSDVIDTIAWEGFREGIDDIRYATKLKQVAAAAIASGQQERVTAANKALTWLDAVDERSTNQDLLRLEMIRHILHMLDLENAQ